MNLKNDTYHHKKTNNLTIYQNKHLQHPQDIVYANQDKNYKYST